MNLTEEQMAAATCDSPNIAVIAGPGTGKTSVLVERVRYLVCDRGIDPSEILVVTFTRRAADEISQRIAMPQVTCGTFHAIALSGHHDSTVRVIDQDEQIAILSRVKAENYPSYLKVNGLIDYDGLIDSMAKQACDPISKLRSYRHILVDECQDTDEKQFTIIKTLSQDADLFAVGDPMQAIYGWRGANVDQFTRGCDTILNLTLDFRNPADVVAAANAVANAVDANAVPVIPCKLADGLSFRQNAIESAQMLMDSLYQPSDIAVLARTNRTVKSLTRDFRFLGIPVRDSKPTHSLLPLLQFLARPSESLVQDARESIQPASGANWIEVMKSAETLTERMLAAELASNWMSFLPDTTVSSILEKIIFDEEAGKEVFFWNTLYGYCRVLDAVNDYAIHRSELDDDEDEGVTICTTHQAKGLEWPAVIAIAEGGDSPEDHRVWRVAMTRAMERLVVCEPFGPNNLSSIVRRLFS